MTKMTSFSMDRISVEVRNGIYGSPTLENRLLRAYSLGRNFDSLRQLPDRAVIGISSVFAFWGISLGGFYLSSFWTR